MAKNVTFDPKSDVFEQNNKNSIKPNLFKLK